MKPIKVKKKDRACYTCTKYYLYYCSKAGATATIPIKVLRRGCKHYKKNKWMFF